MYQIQSDKLNYFEQQINNPLRKITYKFTLNDEELLVSDIMDNPTLVTDTGLEQYGVGCTLITQLQMSIKQDVLIIPKDKITIEIGLDIYNEVTQEWETLYTPMGVFYVDTIEQKGMKKSIKAYDGMYKLNKGYFPSTKHTNTQAIANDIATANGYKLKGISNVNINNEQLEGKTCVEMLSLVASAIGGHVRISRDGSSIEFIEPTNYGLLFDESDYTTPTMDNATTYNITKLRINYSDKVTNDEGIVTDEGYYEVGKGTNPNTLELSNPLLKGQHSQATNVLNKIKQLNGYKRFDTSMPLADFRLEPMDMVAYTKGEVEYIVPILYMKMVLSYQGISIETQSPTVAETKSEFSFKGTLSQKVENIYTDIIQVKQLTANKVTTDELEATVATIEKLYATKAEIGELVAGSIVVEDLKVQIAQINEAIITKAEITDLEAINATISNLKAKVAEIDTLIADSILSEIIQAGSISSDLLNVKDGFIKDAMINSLSASKINSGTINTNNVSVQSENGDMLLQGNLLQFKDKNGKIRIQIGQDTTGNYTFTLYDSTGKGVLINQDGIQSSNAIKDGLIVDSKISDSANINGSKLDIASLYEHMNEDGSNTLKASKIYFDDKAQTLDVSFKEMTTKQDELEDTMTTAITDIEVSQGQISQLIQDTTITTSEGTTTLKDAYNHTKSTVDSHTTQIGKVESTLDSHSGQLGTVSNEVSNLKVGLNSIETGLSSLEKEVGENYYTKAQTDSAIKVVKDEINLGVSQNYETKVNVETKVTTTLNNAKSYADVKKDEAIETASSDATNKVNSAKTELNNSINTKANKNDVYIKSEVYTKSQTDSAINVAKNEINLGVSNTYETKTNVENKINDINSSISSLDTRMSSAESKITEDAITNLVKKNFYSKEETNTEITSKGYQTASQVQQTVDNVTFNFNQSGGYNLLLNSRWEYDMFNWGSLPSSHSRIQDGNTGLYYIRGSVVKSSNQGFVQVFKVEKGRPYTVSAQVDLEDGVVVGVEFSWTDASGTKRWSGKRSTQNYKNGIIYHTETFDMSGDVQINFFVDGYNSTTTGAYARWRYTQVEQGRTHTGWSPNPYEIYQGQTLINKNGVRVNASNVGTYTQMSADGFFVKYNNGNKLFEASNSIKLFDNNNVSAFEVLVNPSASYGNAMVNIRGGINFLHKPGQSTGTNGIQLGNHDISNQYGMHNLSIRCWNSLGFSDNNNSTNMFADVRRGRWIMKGALYQNTATPPATFSMNFNGEDEVYNSGYTRSQAIDSVMNLKTGVYVDNDGECCSAIYGGYSELITTEYSDEDGNMTTHLNHEALNASLVVTCQEQQKLINVLQQELNEIKEYLKIT